MAKKSEKKEAKEKNHAEILNALFDDFYNTASRTFASLERLYNVDGFCVQVFGDTSTENVEVAKSKLKATFAWATLNAVYNYAVLGIPPAPEFDGESSLVIDASDVLLLASSEEWRPSQNWEEIIWMADGRFSLDDGSPVLINKLALLANVDIRTIRNAISANELAIYKNPADDLVYVENASARAWLKGRRGFKPTVSSDIEGLTLQQVKTPAMFGTFLIAQRKQREQDIATEGMAKAHPAITPQLIAELETGHFPAPLDVVFPIADFYLLDRKQFLQCVMRVFFSEALSVLTSE